MAKLVLKILEGPDRGREYPIPPSGSLSLGRKSSCDVTLSGDEKISGQHAEVALEAGALVLRDLGSTNGTRVDGKRIEELPVEHGDQFMVGQTLIQVIDKDQASPGSELGLEIDQDLLAKTAKRSPVGLLVLIVILAAGAGGWYFLQGGGEGGGARRGRARSVQAIPGNLLPKAAAHLEGGGENPWLPGGTGASFRIGAPGFTGKGALEASIGSAAAEEGSAAPLHALAFSSEISVQGGTGLEARAKVRSTGAARVALRLCFLGEKRAEESSEDGGEDGSEDGTQPARFVRRPDYVAGSELLTIDGSDWKDLKLRSSAPLGTRSVVLAVVALLPETASSTAEASVAFDDIALVRSKDRAAAKLELGSRELVLPEGNEAASSCRLLTGGELALLSIGARPRARTDRPAKDAALAALAKDLVLPLSDAIPDARYEAVDAGFVLKGKLSDGFDLVFLVPASILENGGYSVRRQSSERESFEFHASAAELPGTSSLLFGRELHRVLVWIGAPTTLRCRKIAAGAEAQGALEFSFRPELPMKLQLGFTKEFRDAQRLLREAEAADSAKQTGKALSLFGKILADYPFDTATTKKASLRQGQLLLEAQGRIDRMRTLLEEAKAFRYPGLFESVAKELRSLRMLYAASGRKPLLAEIDKLFSDTQEGLTKAKSAGAEDRSSSLKEIYMDLEASGKTRLAALVKEVLLTRFPKTAAAIEVKTGKKPDGKDSGGESPESAGERKDG